MELNMKALRKKKGLTQEQIAKAIGASKRQVGAWERGENDLPMDYAVAIADLLDCTIDDMAGRVDYYFITIPEGDDDLEELAGLYRDMTDEGRKQLMIYARGLAATYPKNQVDKSETA